MTGFFILIELSPRLQRWFSYRPLVFLGRLSFSIVLTSGIVMMSLGPLIYQHLVLKAGISNISTLTGIMFLITAPLCLVVSFIWAIIIDDNSVKLSHIAYVFLTT